MAATPGAMMIDVRPMAGPIENALGLNGPGYRREDQCVSGASARKVSGT
jgi:hypothetical protein